MPDKFILHSNYKPTGDQPEAIDKLVKGIENGLKEQVLLGVTGSGKTFTMANVIERVNRRRWFLLTIKHLPHNFAVSSANSSRRMRLNTLYPTTSYVLKMPILCGFPGLYNTK